jgi:hypothetical protein
MSIIRITRFQLDPADVEEMLSRRAALISAVRDACAGPAEARLGRLDDESWMDVWTWDTAEDLRAALEAAPRLPAAGAAFALVKDATAEQAEIVDER